MKKLYSHIILFLIPVIAFLILIQPNKRLRYTGLKDDCFNHGIWVHDRIFENPDPFDIAVLGSSHTINAVNDEIMDSLTNDKSVVNFGYCRLGRNLTYVLLKDILAEKSPETIIVEVREDEDRYSHPVFPLVANTTDVLLPVALFNRDIFADMWTHFSYKTELFRDNLFNAMEVQDVRLEDYGFASHPDTAKISYLDSIKKKRSIYKEPLARWERDFHMKYPKAYLKKVRQLCEKNNQKLFFLYLPSYGRPFNRPKNSNFYSNQGRLLIPPDSILENKDYWYDKSHMNKAGANALSRWLAHEIQ
ncbi:MAG: hypothetical protein K9H84_07010 [Bacteroidales bacterium]|nr:hypothetical protein [Bacteroidales bacterium]